MYKMDRAYWFKIEAFRYRVGGATFSLHKGRAGFTEDGCRGPIHTDFEECCRPESTTWWLWAEKQSALLNVPNWAFSLWLYQITKALRSQWQIRKTFLDSVSIRRKRGLVKPWWGHHRCVDQRQSPGFSPQFSGWDFSFQCTGLLEPHTPWSGG